MHDIAKDLPYFHLFIGGLGLTVIISLGAIIVGLIIGTFAGLGRASNIGWLRTMLGLYVELMRSLPLLLLLFVTYYAVPQLIGYNIYPLAAAIAAQGIYIGAYMTEVIKGGIQAVPHGQVEASQALSLNYRTTMIKVIAPQALRILTPPLISLLITSVKESSLASIIGVVEITQVAVNIRSQTYSVWPPLLTLAAIYLIVNLVLSTLGSNAERRFGRNTTRLPEERLMA